MNAQSKNLTRIAAALVLAMACGNTWAVDNSITFEKSNRATGNGTNNAGNIDGSGGAGIDVRIRQINDPAEARDVATSSKMNQVGDYVGDTPITIGDTAKVRIGQGVKFDGTGEAFDDATEANSKNNLVKGSITGTSQAYISQTGASGSRLANVTMTGGTLKANQTASNQELLVTTMSGGELNVNQKSTATDSKVTIAKFTGGTTTINQGTLTSETGDGKNSNLTLDSGEAGVSATYGANTGVTINQYGNYQDATVKYVNGGYDGNLNLGAQGDATHQATVDVKM